MPRFQLMVNGQVRTADVDADTPLLWVLRDALQLCGAKYGCGKGLCGACTVHVDGQAQRACQLPVAGLGGRRITTIEGLHPRGEHPLQQAWIRHDVPQCGYCQAGQIMQAAALLQRSPKPSDTEIDAAMAGNLCRCGTFLRIRAAIKDAAGLGAST
jgi:isoquinoline 1-oxidoreductase alpha subunit